MLKRVIIDRDIPKAGAMNAAQLKEAACTSNDALAELAPKAQWEHSYVAGDKTFCI